jgi:hypothetical protein
LQGINDPTQSHALTDIIDVVSAIMMAKKEKRIVCTRLYELLREVQNFLVDDRKITLFLYSRE